MLQHPKQQKNWRSLYCTVVFLNEPSNHTFHAADLPDSHLCHCWTCYLNPICSLTHTAHARMPSVHFSPVDAASLHTLQSAFLGITKHLVSGFPSLANYQQKWFITTPEMDGDSQHLSHFSTVHTSHWWRSIVSNGISLLFVLQKNVYDISPLSLATGIWDDDVSRALDELGL